MRCEMSFSPLWPAMPPPCLMRAVPGAKSSSSCTTRISSGSILKKPASICTARPLAFMKRLRQQQPGAVARCVPTSAWYFGSLRSATPLDCGEALDQPEAGVVPRALVLLARVAQADDEADRRHLLLVFLVRPLSAARLGARPCRRALPPFFALGAASPSFAGAACAVVGTSAAETTAASAAFSSSSVTSCGTTTVATTGSSLLCSDSSTPFGSFRSRTWIELPTARLLQVDLDELRQVVRQAGDVELVQHVADHAALLLHARAILGVDEVQRHLHVDLLVLRHALEVDVQHLLLERMHAAPRAAAPAPSRRPGRASGSRRGSARSSG